jgi:heme-degrading monooxygenase HmoA
VTQTRPNKSVEWFDPRTSHLVSDDFRQHMLENYLSNGKHLGVESSESEDGLKLILVSRWDSAESFLAWKADPKCADFFTAQLNYFDDTLITKSVEIEEDV